MPGRSKYERITFKDDGTSRTYILRDPIEKKFLGADTLQGRRVGYDLDEIVIKGCEQYHIIELALVSKRVELVEDFWYGGLVVKGTESNRDENPWEKRRAELEEKDNGTTN